MLLLREDDKAPVLLLVWKKSPVGSATFQTRFSQGMEVASTQTP